MDLFKSKKKLKFTPQQEIDPSTSVIPSMDITSRNVRPVSFTSSVGTSTSTCTLSQAPNSPPLIDADTLIDSSSAEFSEFLCAKLPDSSPEKSPEKVQNSEDDRFAVLRRRSRKRKSFTLDKGRSAKKLKLTPSSGLQPGIADVFKLKSDSATASIPVSSPGISTRSKSCSSDFTDGASTCSDLISDDDTDIQMPSAATSSDTIDLTIEIAGSSKAAPQTVIPTLRRSPRESVRQKALQCPSVTPSKGSRKRLRFSDSSNQPRINDFMRNTKSTRLTGIRL